MASQAAVDRQVRDDRRLSSSSGVSAQFTEAAVLRRLDVDGRSVLLYPADELESGPANLFLRVRGKSGIEVFPLLGPESSGGVRWTETGPVVSGTRKDLDYRVTFRLAEAATAWFWHVEVTSRNRDEVEVDVVHAQDVALAPYAAVRTNEYYVSQYLDLTPIPTDEVGTSVAVRQNMPGATAPWALFGSLGHGVGWGTDALQLPSLTADVLPNSRLQHEHTLVLLQDRPAVLRTGETLNTGFFGIYHTDHPAASSADDDVAVAVALSQPEARPLDAATDARDASPIVSSLFSTAPSLPCVEIDENRVSALAGPGRHHVERDGSTLLGFFTDDGAHVVTRAKERLVLRPHGHVMRTGDTLVPDEGSLTSTAWMAGTFHSQVTQGHVARNAILSTRRSYLGLKRAHGLRVFVESAGVPDGWALLDVPSAWSVAADGCRWWYQHEGGLIEVVSAAPAGRHELELSIRVLEGPPCRALVCAHVALGGDDGQDPHPPGLDVGPSGATIRPPAGSLAAQRFPGGHVRVSWAPGSVELVGRDEELFADGESRDLPWVVVRTQETTRFDLSLTAALIPAEDLPARTPGDAPWPEFWPGLSRSIRLEAPQGSPLAEEVEQLDAILPWFAHDALVHYLSPRGLEQYTGGAWGTRDVCQGPIGLLLALGQMDAIRDLVVRVLGAQNARGDWPQAFEFLPREFRAGQHDSHGDVVFWPLLALGEYLTACGDGSLLAERIPFVGDEDRTADEPVTEHVVRALRHITASTIPGSPLPAYGHGDWNDSLQPADPRMAARMASSWTATLQVHALRTLARGLRHVVSAGALDSHTSDAAISCAATADDMAARTATALQDVLVLDGELAGYALFGEDGSVEHLVHPSDTRTGLRHGVLQTIHAISGDLLTPEQADAHLAVVEEHLLGPDGARLFDRPVRYQGGPMEVFQRAEAATFFGREIGIMYTHAHLRYAEALARHGDAERLFAALALVNPIGVTTRVPSARARQSTCYYSSSDASFADRYDAGERYGQVLHGEVPLEGGWRVYSSGPGIFLRLVVECLLGVRRRGEVLEIDPVLPPSLDGLRASVPLDGESVELTFRVGKRGAGPITLTLNGTPLVTTPLTNPYRAPGVAVEMRQVRSALTPGTNLLDVEVS